MPNDDEKPPPDMKLRISGELRRKIETAARVNGRTLNGEIVSRLEESFGTEPDVRERLALHGKKIEELTTDGYDVAKRVIALQTQIDELTDRLTKLENRL